MTRSGINVSPAIEIVAMQLIHFRDLGMEYLSPEVDLDA
jgi:hypothetical protein